MAVILLACLASAARAQAPQPFTDRDAQAFYCSRVTPYLLDMLKDVPRPSASDMTAHPELKEVVRRLDSSIARFERDQRRLSAYVAAKIAFADASRAALAVAGGEDDVTWLKAATASHACGAPTSPRARRCMDRELKLSGVGSRVARCRDLSWLPAPATPQERPPPSA